MISSITEVDDSPMLFHSEYTYFYSPSNMFVGTWRRHSYRYYYRNSNFSDKFALCSDRMLQRIISAGRLYLISLAEALSSPLPRAMIASRPTASTFIEPS